MSEPAQTTDRWVGSRWVSFAVSSIVISILALFLTDRLFDMEERSERFVVDITVRNMRTGMQLAMGEAAFEGKKPDVALWVGSNPIQWLGTPPAGYVGDCPAAEDGVPAGAWCFDVERRELLYRPRRTSQLKSVASGGKPIILKWRVVVVQPGNDVSVQLITPFSWEGG